MAAYILTRNPRQWPCAYLQVAIEQVKKQGYYRDAWDIGHKAVVAGDRVFLMRLQPWPSGIFASGWAVSNVYEREYEDRFLRDSFPPFRSIDIHLDVLLDPDHEPILPRHFLEQGVFHKMRWNTQRSGTIIPEDVADALETKWTHFLASSGRVQQHIIHRSVTLPEEMPDDQTYLEGAASQVTVNAYERNPKARKKCIEYYGLNCSICGFNFKQVYGEVGLGSIHVHHLKPLSEIGAEYEVDPIEDLRPVCPNCHAIIHRRNPPYSIEEVKQFLRP